MKPVNNLFKYSILITIFILIISGFNSPVSAFRYFNRRNHPELDWKQLESENITVVYHKPLYDTAKEALRIGESAYTSLVKTYDIKLDKKVKIFISNRDDISNGFSLAGRFIIIIVDEDDYVNLMTGRDTWLRRVLVHEMSHHFLFHTVSSWLNYFITLENPFPITFNEGYAMFFSGEPWGYGRSDALLKKAVFSDDLKEEYSDGIHYAKGFSMVRYLYKFYGLEKLQELLKYRTKHLKLYDFEEGFKKVYDKSFEDFKEEWRRYIYTYYYGEASNLKKELENDTTVNITLNALAEVEIKDWSSINEIVFDDSVVFLTGKISSSQYYNDLAYGFYDRDTLQLKNRLEFSDLNFISKSFRVRNLDVSGNLRFLA
ncbi:MAG TPA: hypothetical protein VKO43_03070, partial [Candidatus Krumholzibacteriaceae bacterium]|nr:hypothetical protein [Candidatus Krumholzibacteriaceae bacterium]